MRVFITGGAGFIGCNLAAYHLKLGNDVILLDNLSRPRTQYNLNWLQSLGSNTESAPQEPALPKAVKGSALKGPSAFSIEFHHGDVRDFEGLRNALELTKPDLVVHLASQVTVTRSVTYPREDFEINALGTFNVLEAIRAQSRPPAMIYASTNKVYGGMEDVAVVLDGNRYRYRDFPNGISERQPLDFHSPYGCSKGAGDQYVRDYARIYGLRTVVFRQSTIYGPHQLGLEDQGWLAWLIIATLTSKPITIYGDGKQVRDMLHVTDLIAAYNAAWERIDEMSGQIFNIGGGAANTLTIWSEAGPMLEEFAGRKIPVTYANWRPGDQRVFISDNSKLKQLLNWEPKVNVRDGARQLWDWASENRDLFA